MMKSSLFSGRWQQLLFFLLISPVVLLCQNSPSIYPGLFGAPPLFRGNISSTHYAIFNLKGTSFEKGRYTSHEGQILGQKGAFILSLSQSPSGEFYLSYSRNPEKGWRQKNSLKITVKAEGSTDFIPVSEENFPVLDWFLTAKGCWVTYDNRLYFFPINNINNNISGKPGLRLHHEEEGSRFNFILAPDGVLYIGKGSLSTSSVSREKPVGNSISALTAKSRDRSLTLYKASDLAKPFFTSRGGQFVAVGWHGDMAVIEKELTGGQYFYDFLNTENGELYYRLNDEVVSSGKRILSMVFTDPEYAFEFIVSDGIARKLFTSSVFKPFTFRRPEKWHRLIWPLRQSEGLWSIFEIKGQFFVNKNGKNQGPLALNEEFRSGAALFQSCGLFGGYFYYLRGRTLVKMDIMSGKIVEFRYDE